MKRIFLIAGAALLLLLAAFLAYFFLVYRKEVPKDTVDIALPEDTRVELTEEERVSGKDLEEKHEEIRQDLNLDAAETVYITKIIDRRVVRPTINSAGDRIMFFDPAEQEILSTDLNGDDVETLTSGSFENVEDITWSPTKDVLIFSYSDGSPYTVLEIEGQILTELDPRVLNPVFSPDGLRIVYLFNDDGADVYRITTALRDGSNAQPIKTYRNGGIFLDWYAEEGISYGGISSGYDAATVYSMDTRGEKNRTLVAERYAADLLFSPDGSRVAVSDATRKPATASLLMMENDGQGEIDTLVDTLARKCAWSPSGSTVMCGVPSEPFKEYIIPEDYEDESWVTRDSLYRINPETGESHQVVAHYQFSEGYDISEPFLTDRLDRLFFIRRNDGHLYAYSLP